MSESVSVTWTTGRTNVYRVIRRRAEHVEEIQNSDSHDLVTFSFRSLVNAWPVTWRLLLLDRMIEAEERLVLCLCGILPMDHNKREHTKGGHDPDPEYPKEALLEDLVDRQTGTVSLWSNANKVPRALYTRRALSRPNRSAFFAIPV